MAILHVLALGDICGPETVGLLSAGLSAYKKENGIDFVLVNGENATTGNGLDEQTAQRLLASGVDVITSGNHIWKWRNVYPLLDATRSILRPANYPPEDPGKGHVVLTCKDARILVLNVMGTVYLEPLEDPMRTIEAVLSAEEGNYDFSILDFHGEATGEKQALMHFFDGRLTAFLGTHTHVQTADERILPGGTAAITDLGMSGPENSVLGIRSDIIIKKMKTKMPLRFEFAQGGVVFCGVSLFLDTDTGKAASIVRRTSTLAPPAPGE